MDTALQNDSPFVLGFFKSDAVKRFIDVLHVQIHLAVSWIIIYKEICLFVVQICVCVQGIFHNQRMLC